MGRDGFESTSMSRYLPTSANMSRQKFSGTMTLATSSAASSSWRLMDNPLAEPPGVSLAHLAPTHPRYPGGDRSEDRRRTEKSTPSTGAVDARAVMTEMTAKPVRQETLLPARERGYRQQTAEHHDENGRHRKAGEDVYAQDPMSCLSGAACSRCPGAR